jgi:hypothetical protein
MRGSTILSAGLLVLAALLACKSKSKGTLQVDGVQVEIETCRSGQANSPRFNGVDFIDSSGRRIRYLVTPEGALRNFFFEPGVTRGDLVGERCGTMSLTEQSSEVNNVKNIKGSVTANCTGAGHVIVATVNFENCH